MKMNKAPFDEIDETINADNGEGKLTEQRVELHLHTKMSDDISTISVSDAFEFAEECNHKAIAFTNMNNVQDFPEIEREARKHENIKAIYGADIIYETDEGGPFAVTLLVKNQKGIKELYKIISSMTEKGDTKFAHISSVEQNRDNLLCGASGNMSELFYEICEKKTTEEITAAALQYDYIEIFPTDDIETRAIYRKMFDLGKELNIPVVATGNCHYCSKGDEICRRVFRVLEKFKEAIDLCDDNAQLYLRSTEEMLEAFAYLGNEDAYQAVVKNTNKVADLTDEIYPLSNEFSYFNIPNADKEICTVAKEKAHCIYGDKLSSVIEERLNKELKLIIEHGYSSVYMLAYLLVKYAHDKAYQTMSRGRLGSSFVAFLLGITNVNPLPPHYYCGDCSCSDFVTDNTALSGYDLQDKSCPICGKPFKKDGHNIPYEVLMGFDGSKQPDIDINFPSFFREEAVKHLVDIFGEDKVLLAGYNAVVTENTASMYVNAYQEITGKELSSETEEHIKRNINGIKRQESSYLGGIFILPKDKDIYDYTPYRCDERHAEIKKVTHFDFHSILNNLYKIGILGYITLDPLSLLKKYTGISPEEIDINDPKIYALLKDSRPIGIDSDEPATVGLSELGSKDIRNMIKLLKPQSFSELVKVLGLCHGWGTWFGNAKYLLSHQICELKDIAATGEDVFNYLTEQGVEKEIAFNISEAVRKGIFGRRNKGKGIYNDPETVKALTANNIPQCYIDQLCEIRYMFPKAHIVESVKTALILGWYKVYYPIEFYTANLNVYHSERKYGFLADGENKVKEYLFNLQAEGSDKYTPAKDNFALFEECADRGIEFKRSYRQSDGSELYSVKDGMIIVNY